MDFCDPAERMATIPAARKIRGRFQRPHERGWRFAKGVADSAGAEVEVVFLTGGAH